MSILTQLYKSLYSPKDMARFRFQKVGKAIVYVLFLAFLTAIPTTIAMGNLLQAQLSLFSNTIQKDLPDFTIKNKILVSPTTEPFQKETPDSLFVFDANTTEYKKSHVPNQLHMLKDRLVVVEDGQEQEYRYDALGDFEISKDDVEKFMLYIHKIYPVALFVMCLFLFVVNAFSSFLSITLLAIGGLFIAQSMQRKLQYRQAWTVTAYAITIPTVFFAITNALAIAVSFHFLLFVGVSFFLLFLIIKEIPQAKK